MSNYKFKKDFFTDGYTIYDKNNKKIGQGKKIGYADRNFFNDGFSIYGMKKNKLGQADHNFFTDDYNIKNKSRSKNRQN